MITGKFNIVTDGQWGSCGKGAITTYLAYKYQPQILTTTNMANAGHTAVNSYGSKFVAKALPSATILNKWMKWDQLQAGEYEYRPIVVVGASAAYDINQLFKEKVECMLDDIQLIIHPRSGVITERHKQAEESNITGTKHIASTMQGCGSFLAEKIMRYEYVKLAKDYEELSPYINKNITCELHQRLSQKETILHEGSQGYSLCINHGSHYPQCTSRSTTAIQNMADMGMSAKEVGDIYLVIRPYPIRVGNVVENSQVVGYSGDCYEDQKEISWADVAQAAGAPAEEMNKELTTVTKRLRRVFTFSDRQLKEAVAINGATKIALNFANYIDWQCYGINQYDNLTQKVKDYVTQLEQKAGIPVSLVGTGPQLNHVCNRESLWT